ncbi:MAG TPA: NAD-dependent epimerase/dehydratase family protein, partial [bacterium]|nr:NAD-dependent epimerase/dehydratase family protein [bacterium]
IMKDERPLIYGDGEQTRDFTYVENVIKANILAATVDCDSGIILNCACNERTSVNQLVNEINGILGKDIVPEYAEPRAGDVKDSYAVTDKAKLAINYSPEIKFKEGLLRTIEWYKNNN